MSQNTDPASRIQDINPIDSFHGVNPGISDSAMFQFDDPEEMAAIFAGSGEPHFLYSRHSHPSLNHLGDALAALEGSEAALPVASGMASIACAILQHCQAGSHVVCSRTVYGGTYALLQQLFPRFGITTTFVDGTSAEAVGTAMQPNTAVVFLEFLSNPLLEVAPLPEIAQIAHEGGAKLIVDNTFTPMICSPLSHGADVVIHSLTKFINGASDTVGGCICGSAEFVEQLKSLHDGASMLLGPVMDSLRAASILKNMHTLHVRMAQHSRNAHFLATKLEEKGLEAFYPGLPSHPHHERFTQIMNPGLGYGGMMTLDMGTGERANQLIRGLKKENVGILSVSLGYFKTLFSASASSTSSEIPEEERHKFGLREGLVRFSVGLDYDIERTWERIERTLATL